MVWGSLALANQIWRLRVNWSNEQKQAVAGCAGATGSIGDVTAFTTSTSTRGGIVAWMMDHAVGPVTDDPATGGASGPRRPEAGSSPDSDWGGAQSSRIVQGRTPPSACNAGMMPSAASTAASMLANTLFIFIFTFMSLNLVTS